MGGRSGWVAWVVGLGGWLGWVTWVGGLGGRPVVRVAGPDDRPESFPSISRGFAAVSVLTESEPGPSMGHPTPGTVYAGHPMPGYAGTSHAWDCAWRDVPERDCAWNGHEESNHRRVVTIRCTAVHGGTPYMAIRCTAVHARTPPKRHFMHSCTWSDVLVCPSGVRLCME